MSVVAHGASGVALENANVGKGFKRGEALSRLILMLPKASYDEARVS